VHQEYVHYAQSYVHYAHIPDAHIHWCTLTRTLTHTHTSMCICVWVCVCVGGCGWRWVCVRKWGEVVSTCRQMCRDQRRNTSLGVHTHAHTMYIHKRGCRYIHAKTHTKHAHMRTHSHKHPHPSQIPNTQPHQPIYTHPPTHPHPQTQHSYVRLYLAVYAGIFFFNCDMTQWLIQMCDMTNPYFEPLCMAIVYSHL